MGNCICRFSTFTVRRASGLTARSRLIFLILLWGLASSWLIMSTDCLAAIVPLGPLVCWLVSSNVCTDLTVLWRYSKTVFTFSSASYRVEVWVRLCFWCTEKASYRLPKILKKFDCTFGTVINLTAPTWASVIEDHAIFSDIYYVMIGVEIIEDMIKSRFTNN